MILINLPADKPFTVIQCRAIDTLAIDSPAPLLDGRIIV